MYINACSALTRYRAVISGYSKSAAPSDYHDPRTSWTRKPSEPSTGHILQRFSVISTSRAPRAIGPYSQAVIVGGTMYISGQLGLLPTTMDFPSEDVELQTHQVFTNLKAILEEAGLTLKDVVKTTVLLSSMNDFAKVNAIYAEYRFQRAVSSSVDFRSGLSSKAYSLGILDNRHLVARYRWRKLAENIFRRPSKSLEYAVLALELDPVGLELFEISALSSGSQESRDEDQETTWIAIKPVSYHSSHSSHPSKPSDTGTIHLRVYTSLSDGDTVKSRIHTLGGFDNTGNVRLWPCELILTHAMLCPDMYPGVWIRITSSQQSIKNICELGAGMTGSGALAASLSPCLCSEFVLLTDGNVRCVDSLQRNIEHHVARLSKLNIQTQLEAYRLFWSDKQDRATAELPHRFRHSFQLVMASDCFFHTTEHTGLLSLVDALLAVDSHALFIAIAPLRGKTLQHFVDRAALDHNWQVALLSPREYMASGLYESILNKWSGKEEHLLDKSLGHLIILQRHSVQKL
ncbi:unnamed protein product [Dicrocoelium dendriticum]|nr:unnamed protein product [Dicrocoelium dendriticum]